MRNPLDRFTPPALTQGTPGDPGLFGPGSAAWRVTGERLLLAGGPTALLLQVAHPLVAAGVDGHSDFTEDPLQRLRGTVDAVLTMTFGDTEQVRAAARRVARRHRPVRGTLPTTTGTVGAGTPYRATDPELARWVLASLTWAAVRTVETFHRPLHPRERDAYVGDMSRLGGFFAVPEPALPQGWDGLERYVHAQVRDVLAVGDTAARIAREVLRPDPPIVPAPVRPLPGVLTAGLLPAPVREAYGLPWRRRERAAFTAVRATSRLLLPWLPGGVRRWPHVGVAHRRVARGTAAAGSAVSARP